MKKLILILLITNSLYASYNPNMAISDDKLASTNYVYKASGGKLVQSRIFDNGNGMLIGDAQLASGISSIAMGENTQALGQASTALGSNTVAVGDYSIAMGALTVAYSLNETVVGSFNTSYTGYNTEEWVPTDRLFVIGNGTYLAASNAMTVLKNGNVGIGTDVPQAKLHVVNSNTGAGLLRLQNSGGSALDVNGIDFYHYTGYFQAYIRDEIASGWGTKLHFGTASSSNNATTRMTIDSVGNIGIGTMAPASLLHLEKLGVKSTYYNMLTITTPTWTTGPWHFATMDDASYAYLFVRYGATSIMRYRHNQHTHFYGTLDADIKLFNIKHPDPVKAQAGWRLKHACVEGPTAGDTLSRYVVETQNNTAEIVLPDYFKFLNENVQVWVSPVQHFGVAYGELIENKVVITANLDGKYNVLIVGTRKDEAAKKAWAQEDVEFIDASLS